ncbi:MAG: hypothetical protein ABI624_11310, partial [Casimicrobiaceae bacterium]
RGRHIGAQMAAFAAQIAGNQARVDPVGHEARGIATDWQAAALASLSAIALKTAAGGPAL